MTFFRKVPDKTKKSGQKNYSKVEGLRKFFLGFLSGEERRKREVMKGIICSFSSSLK